MIAKKKRKTKTEISKLQLKKAEIDSKGLKRTKSKRTAKIYEYL